MTISFLLVWHLPQGSETYLFFSLLVVSALLNSSLALFSIPYVAVANDVEPDNQKRKSWIGWRVVFLNVGSIFGLSVAAIYMTQQSSSSEQNSYSGPTLILSVVTLLTSIFSIYYVEYLRRRVRPARQNCR